MQHQAKCVARKGDAKNQVTCKCNTSGKQDYLKKGNNKTPCTNRSDKYKPIMEDTRPIEEKVLEFLSMLHDNHVIDD